MRGLAIIALLALAGCSERFDPSLDWECRLKTKETVFIEGIDRRDPSDWGGTDRNGRRWRRDDITVCRQIEARP